MGIILGIFWEHVENQTLRKLDDNGFRAHGGFGAAEGRNVGKGGKNIIRRPSRGPGAIWQKARVMTMTTKKKKNTHIFF